MVNSTLDNSYLTFSEYQASVLIWKVVPPILISFGTVGNILSIIVLTRKLIKTSTTALYLTCLAFSDLMVLYTGLLRQWLKFLIEKDVRHISEAACKIHMWLVYSSLDFSAWILIAVTLERVISTWCPHSAKTKCNKKYAFILLIGMLFLCLGLNSHLLFGMVDKVSKDGKSVQKCATIDEDYSAFFNLTWPWIDLCAFCLIPFSVIVVGNACILFKVVKSRKKARPRVQPSIRSLHNNNQQNHHNHSSMTAMLFTLNMVFLITTSPISIYNIGYPIWLEGASQEKQASLEFWWAVVNMLMYTNNSLNFLLYCLSGSKFRQEVKRLFCSTSNQSSNITLNDVKRTRGRANSQIPSHNHTAEYDRDISFIQNQANPVFASTDDRLTSNGFADINSLFQTTSAKSTRLKTTTNGITEMIREASNVTSSILYEKNGLHIPNENERDLNHEPFSKNPCPDSTSGPINERHNVRAHKFDDSHEPMSNNEEPSVARYDTVGDNLKSIKKSADRANVVTVRKIDVMPSIEKAEVKERSVHSSDDNDNLNSEQIPTNRQTSFELKALTKFSSLDNDVDSNQTADNDNALDDSANITQDEESSILSGCRTDNKTSILSVIYKQNDTKEDVYNYDDSPNGEIKNENLSSEHETKADFNVKSSHSNIENNMKIISDDTTRTKDQDFGKITDNICSEVDEIPETHSTKYTTLDDGIKLESVSSV